MSAVDTAVRDRISEYLAGRGGFGEPASSSMEWAGGGEATQIVWTSTKYPEVAVVLNSYAGRKASVWVETRSQDGQVPTRHLTIGATAPDLLARLGETLDGLVC